MCVQIITINLPNSYVKALEKLTADLGLFPSRSEAIRTALRQFVDKELEYAEKLEELNNLEVKRTSPFLF